jgi:CubicO group peptidase (beta-lactamase class C family)
MFLSKNHLALYCALPFILLPVGQVQASTPKIENEAALNAAVTQEVNQLMQQHQLPGMAIAVLWQGNTYHYSFGLADLASKTAVTPDTLFELGSISKTYAGVLGAMAIESGAIALTDPVAKHWPALTNPQWQQINMQHLATYTAGGLPLFMPDSVKDKASLQDYYQQWQPQYAPGTQRVYANSSIGLFAHLAVAADGKSYTDAFAWLKTALKLNQTFLQVPTALDAKYAWGYNEGKPVRIGSGVLLDEAGGAKGSVRDVASWVQANMQPEQVSAPSIKAAIKRAQQRYAQAGQMYQGLGWEMLDYPVSVAALSAMTDPDFVKGSAAKFFSPAAAAVPSSWVHKTGATGGFGAYAAFIPSRQVGIVMLSNKRYPNAQRVELAYRILENLK